METNDSASATTGEFSRLDHVQNRLEINVLEQFSMAGHHWANPNHPWHAGRRHGRTLYFGEGPDDGVGYMDTRDLATYIVTARNLVLRLIRECDYNGHLIQKLKDCLHRDQTGLVHALQGIKTRAESSIWISDGRGNYQYNDDDYRKEARWALEAIVTLVNDALVVSGDIAHVLCCNAKPKDVAEPRGAENQMLRTALERIAQIEPHPDVKLGATCPVCLAKRTLREADGR